MARMDGLNLNCQRAERDHAAASRRRIGPEWCPLFTGYKLDLCNASKTGVGLGRVKTREQVLNRPWLQCIEALEACEQYFSDFVCSAT